MGYDVEEKQCDKDKIVVSPAMRCAINDVKMPMIQLALKDVQ